MAGFASPASASGSTIQLPVEKGRHVPGEILLKIAKKAEFDRGLRQRISGVLEGALGEKSVRSIEPLVTDSRLYQVKLVKEQDLKSALKTLSSDPSIEFAEPNYIYHTYEIPASETQGRGSATAFPNDKDFGKLWGMLNTGQKDGGGHDGLAGADISVAPLWQKGIVGDRKIIVAVIDTGVDWDHPDLVKNLFTNTAEIPGNGIDDDKNGFVDDIHGWNFFRKGNNSRDDNEHGTHCAGSIGAEGNNEVGVAGVNWQVSILPVKFLSAEGEGSSVGAIESINYARMMKANVLSNSWGGGSSSQAMKEAIQAARDAGILFVAAAGNDGMDNVSVPSYPASYDIENVVSVAATDNRDQLADFSNYGKNVHVAAPGVEIYSSIKGGGYSSMSGTSMATPHVAGIAALVLSGHPTETYAEIKARLISSSVPNRGLRKKVAARGRVSAYNAYYNIVPPSSEPDEALWKDVVQSLESPHPYQDNSDVKLEIKSPGAKYLRVFFEKVETEARYDKIFVQTPSGEVADTLTGKMTNYVSEYVEGDTAVIRLKSDSSVNGWGFKVSKIQVQN